eukprot:3507534-Rhodomonas_salina.1
MQIYDLWTPFCYFWRHFATFAVHASIYGGETANFRGVIVGHINDADSYTSNTDGYVIRLRHHRRRNGAREQGEVTWGVVKRGLVVYVW